MAVLIVVALVVFVAAQVLGGGSKAAAPQNKPKPKADPTSSSSCNLPDGNQAIPTKGPAAQWVLVAGIAEPRSGNYGPGKRGSVGGECFAHNPAGAIFAAANLSGDLSDPALDTRKLVQARVVHSGGFEGLLRDTTQAKGSSSGAQIAGFRVVSYDSNNADVEIAWKVVEGPKTGGLFAITYTLRWVDGDWRLYVGAGGLPSPTNLASLSGYVDWKGAL